jgi:adenylate kinase family enzyme
MREMFLPRADWVLSGSLNGWGDTLIADFDLVVFLVTPRKIRLQRLRAREATHFGADAVAPGGSHHQETEEFIAWASGYEEGQVSRTLAKHQAWLAELPCPVLRLDGSRPLPELVEEVRRAIVG